MNNDDVKWHLFPKHAGWVYVIEAGGLFKIGHTKNIDDRIRTIQTSCPFPINLVCKYFSNEYASGVEADFHQAVQGFSNSVRLHGEWFNLSDQAIDWLKDCCSRRDVKEIEKIYSE